MDHVLSSGTSQRRSPVVWAIPVKTAFILVLLLMLFALAPTSSIAGEQAYSFVVFGDSRIPAYTPYDRENKDNLNNIVSKVSKYTAKDSEPDYQAVFNPRTLLLERLEIPGATEDASRIITYGRDGWPDVFVDQEGDRAQVSLLASGQEWVYDNVVRELEEGVADPDTGPTFCLHTGDIVYFGFQGKSAESSPYWRDFNKRFLSRLPGGGPGALPARFFPALGNHESWGDEDILGFREMFPYLSQFGFSSQNWVYTFDYNNARFIILDSGRMNPEAPAEWYKSNPGYGEQMDMLAQWLEEAIEDNKDHAFLNLHYPIFCRSGFGPLPREHNPHSLLKSYADKIDITVFTGHVHATEAYSVDGIRYFVAGGGGGEQNLSSNRMPDDYPRDRYWQGNKRQLDYNYLVVRVKGEDVEVVVKRFRPNAFQPFSQIDMVPGRMD